MTLLFKDHPATEERLGNFMDRIAFLRSHIIEGKSVDFFPYGMEYLHETIHLRNQPIARYYLSQNFDITPEQQTEWIKGYESRQDEVGFLIKNKRGEAVGVNFLYNYDGSQMEMGRGIYDTEKLMGQTYAYESFCMMMEIVFEFLQLKKLITIVKEDNTRLLKFYSKMNWTTTGQEVIRNGTYNFLEMLPGQSRHASYEHIMARQSKSTTLSNE